MKPLKKTSNKTSKKAKSNSASKKAGNAFKKLQLSGLYKLINNITPCSPLTDPFGNFKIANATLKLDIDGYYPLKIASLSYFLKTSRVEYFLIAKLKSTSKNKSEWNIFYSYPDQPYGYMVISAIKSIPTGKIPQLKTELFRKNMPHGLPSKSEPLTLIFEHSSPHFRPLSIECDWADNTSAYTEYDTNSHPAKPSDLPLETLTIKKVYERTGFDVTMNPGGAVPIGGAGINARWSDAEIHDAMQSYWSLFADKPKWAFWIFFASLHDMGESLGGIMFDDIGSQHRQGCAIFTDSFINNAPSGDTNATAWINRMKFWCACHESGHCLNLAHSWQKTLGTSWRLLTNNPDSFSLMNYPQNYSGGEEEFFKKHRFRFDDDEILFLRHAPAIYVQPGNAEWFDHHGFSSANINPDTYLRLYLRVNREQPVFEFMEPVSLELKLANISKTDKKINNNILKNSLAMTVIIKKQGKQPRIFSPYSHGVWNYEEKILASAEALYESLFISTGVNGWGICEPGNYLIQVSLDLGNEELISNSINIKVRPPLSFKEELLAQDFFSDDVGRILAMDGSNILEKGNNILRNVIIELPDKRVALHAKVAIGTSLAQKNKILVEGPDKRLSFKPSKAQPEESKKLLDDAIVNNASLAVETLGHIDYNMYANQFTEYSLDSGLKEEARKIQQKLLDTFLTRVVNGKKINDKVLKAIKVKLDAIV